MFETLVVEGDNNEMEDVNGNSEDKKLGEEKEDKGKNRRNRDILPKDEHKLFLKIKHRLARISLIPLYQFLRKLRK